MDGRRKTVILDLQTRTIKHGNSRASRWARWAIVWCAPGSEKQRPPPARRRGPCARGHEGLLWGRESRGLPCHSVWQRHASRREDSGFLSGGGGLRMVPTIRSQSLCMCVCAPCMRIRAYMSICLGVRAAFLLVSVRACVRAFEVRLSHAGA
jgi:hypothetical protein